MDLALSLVSDSVWKGRSGLMSLAGGVLSVCVCVCVCVCIPGGDIAEQGVSERRHFGHEPPGRVL